MKALILGALIWWKLRLNGEKSLEPLQFCLKNGIIQVNNYNSSVCQRKGVLYGKRFCKKARSGTAAFTLKTKSADRYSDCSPLCCRELICGFLSGKNEILNWEPSDLFRFCNDTTPIKGSLDLKNGLKCGG